MALPPEAVDLERSMSQQGVAESRGVVASGPQVSSDSIWTLYNTKAETYDTVLVDRIRASMDSILVFAGLFSAIVTAFIIESYRFLSPKSDDAMLLYLAQISQQLAGLSQNNLTVAPITPPPSQSTPPNVAVNVLFSISLVASLACALCATLVQGWSSRYLRITRQSAIPVEQARTRAFHFEGLQRFQMQIFADSIPALLHVSLFLFFAGLTLFFFPINHVVAYTTMCACTTCAIVYLVFIVLHVAVANSPYRTPLSLVLVAAISCFILIVVVGIFFVVALILSLFALVAFSKVKAVLMSRRSGAPGSQKPSAWHYKRLQWSRLLSRFQNIPDPHPEQDEIVVKWLLSEIRTVPELEQLVKGVGPLIEQQQEVDQQKYAGAILHLGNVSVGNFGAGLGLCIGQLLQLCTDPEDLPLEHRRQRMALSTSALISIFAHSKAEQRIAVTTLPKSPSPTPYHNHSPSSEPDGLSPWDLWANDITLGALTVLLQDLNPDIRLNAACLASLLAQRALTDIATRIEMNWLSVYAPASWDLGAVIQALRGNQHKALPEATIASFLCAPLGVQQDFMIATAPSVIYNLPRNQNRGTRQPLSLRIEPPGGGDLVAFAHDKFRSEAVLLSLLFLERMVGGGVPATPANTKILARTVEAITKGESRAAASNDIRDRFQATLTRLYAPALSPVSAPSIRYGVPGISPVFLEPEVRDILVPNLPDVASSQT